MAVALVLGASGFLGRRVAAAVAASADLELVESDLPGSAAGPRFVGLDLASDATALAAALRRIGPRVIVNCAGLTSGDEARLRAANVDTVAGLLDAIEASGLRPRLVQVGSAAEYGRAEPGRFVGETHPAEPVGPYGSTKLEATRLVTAARASGAVDATVLRVFNVVGPGMPAGTLAGAALARLRTAVATGLDRVEMGPLDDVRDFVDVRDVADAVLAASVAPAVPPIVNVGTGRAGTARDLVAAVARSIGFNGAIEETLAGSARSSAVPWMVADVALAASTLGWVARFDLGEIVASLVSEG